MTSVSLMPPTAGVQHAHRHLVGRQLLRRADDRLERALHVGLDDDRQLLAPRRRRSARTSARACRGHRRPPPRSRAAALAELGDLARAALVLDHDELVAGERHAVEAQHLDRRRRPGLVDRLAARRRAARARGPIRRRRRRCRRLRSVPRCTSTVATGAAAALQLRLRSRRPRRGGSGLALSSRISACSRIASSSLSRPVFLVAETSTSSTSPPISSTTSSCCSSSWRTRSGLASGLSILLMATMIGTFGRLGVADRLDRLRHDAVIGGHHQHHDVGDVGAARAHRGEGLVARRVDEGDLLAVVQRSPDRRRYAG